MDAQSYLGRDRLSELPDSLILDILSLLEMEDVVRTTFLSKRWKDLWTDITCLDFHSSPTFVEGALAKWKGAKILKFSVDDITDTSWLLIPLLKHVEELDVSFNSLAGVNSLATRRLFSCSSITKLTLFRCDLNIGENVNVHWNQLKSLMIGSPINLSEDAMNRILCGAPLLEELILLASYVTDYLCIQSSSLKTLQIDCDYDDTGESTAVMAEGVLRIWAPNLLSLEISACVYVTCLLDAPSLITANIYVEEEFDTQVFAQFFQSFRHVEKLTLSALCIERLLNMKESDMVVLPFSNTKYLSLSAHKANEMLDVLGMFPVLKNLVAVLDDDEDDDCSSSDDDAYNSSASEMSFPNPSLLQLKTINITCYVFNASIIRMVEILLENAHVLEKMVLRLMVDEKKIFTLAKKMVLIMPRSSPTAQVIIRKQ